MTGVSGKLVRDRIPVIIRGSGLEPQVYQADPEEFRERLRSKLIEEVDEVLSADGPEALVDELADVLEVVLALAADAGVDEAGLRAAAARKAAVRGRFEQRLVWTGNEERAGA